jgi:phosphinothricin acetyltransferase
MIIRLARETDLPGMLEISNWAIEHTSANFNVELETLEEWRRGWRGSRDRYPWLVAEEGGAVLGFAKASAYKGRCAYGWTPEVTIYVHPRHHGKGTGRRLYAVLLEILRIQGYNNAVAAISLPNPASERLHASLGFRHVGTLTRAGWKFGRWHDVGYWQLLLHEPDWKAGPILPVEQAWREWEKTAGGRAAT